MSELSSELTRHADHGMAVAVERASKRGVSRDAARDAIPPSVAGRPGGPERVSLARIFHAFLVLGATSFGGGVVAYLRQSLVVREKWMDDQTFLAGLELSQTLPGLNATNMSVYVGERLRGAIGAFVACLGMMLPGAVVVMTLGIVLVQHARTFDMTTILVGVGSAAVGLLLETTWKIARPVIEGVKDVALVAATFIAIGYFHISLVIVLLTIGPLAVFLYRPSVAGRAREGAEGGAN